MHGLFKTHHGDSPQPSHNFHKILVVALVIVAVHLTVILGLMLN